MIINWLREKKKKLNGGNCVVLERRIKAAKERKTCLLMLLLSPSSCMAAEKKKERKEKGRVRERKRLREGRVTVCSAAQLPLFPYKLRNSSGHSQRAAETLPSSLTSWL